MMKTLPKPFKVLALSAFLATLFALLHSNYASAAGSYYLPDPTDFSAGSNVNLEIAQPGSGITLNAPDTWIKFLYDPSVTGSQVGVQVGNGFFRYCGANNADSVGAGASGCEPGDPDYDPGAVKYTVYYGDPATSGTTPDIGFVATSVNSDNPIIDPTVYWSTIYNVPVSARAPIDVGGGNMRYVLYLKAEWNSGAPAEGRINSFKGAVIVAGGLASYWTGNGTYSVQDRLSAPGTQGTFNFGFAPPCDAPASQSANLTWTDADATSLGGVPADDNISFDLYEGDPGSVPSILILSINDSTSPNIGGNNDNRSVSFTAKKNKIYLWRWNDVERINGIQMSIPFDSSNYYVECNGTIQGRVFYDESGDGVYQPGEPLIRNPSGTACGPIYAAAVINISGVGTFTPGSCNPDPYYAASVPVGPHTVSLNPIPGWDITTPPQSITVTGGGVYNPWFGMRISAPNVVTKCVGGNSLADANWPTGISGAASINVDIATSNNFSGNASYRNIGAAATSLANIPNSFITFSGAGVPPGALVDGSPYGVRLYFNGFNVHSAPRPFSASGCPRLVCGTMNPTTAEDGVLFNMTVSFTNNGGASLSSFAKLHVKFPGYYDLDTAYSPSPLPGGGTTAISSPIPLTVPAGIYTVTWTVIGDPASNQLSGPSTPPTGTCTQQMTVFSKPYFRAFGGDVIAGSNAVACPKWFPHPAATSKGSIQAFSNGSGNGAGTQLVAQALSVINGFSSAQSRTANPVPDKGLSFTNNTGNPTYGGNFGAGGCPPDFWANSPSAASANTVNSEDITPAIASGSYLYNPSSGNLNLRATPKIRDDRTLVFYIDGDVTITDNIVDFNTTWASVNNIPSLTIIARGNIYIDSSVSAIDAILVAQPTSMAVGPAGGGNIYTCTIGNALPSPADLADTAGACKANPLTVTGAVVARTIKLFRSSGSVRSATNTEQPTGPTAFAAERFIYTPEVWTRANGVRGTPTLGKYDAVTGLPPVF